MSTSNNKGRVVRPDGRTREGEPEADAIIERLKKGVGASTDMELAQRLGLSRSTISNWRIRNSVPLGRLRAVCREVGVPIDYLMTGRLGSDRFISPPLDSELLGYIFGLLDRYGFIQLPKNLGRGIDPARRAAGEFALLQQQTIELMHRMTTAQHMTVDQAKRAIISRRAKRGSSKETR